MKPTHLLSRHLGAYFVATALTSLFFGSHALGASNKAPTSKLYVSDLKGQVDLSTADTIAALTKKSVFNAQGSTVRTAKEANDAMVYSNGSGIYLDADTRIEVKKFTQEPFTPNRHDLDVEPSISQTVVYVSHGVAALCTSKLVAGSTMTYTTPQATLDIHSKRFVIEVNNVETRVSVLEGDVTVQASGGGAGQILHGGQEAVIRANVASNSSSISNVGPIPDERKKSLDDRTSLACIARHTVYFDVAVGRTETGEDTQDIQATQVVPTGKPTNFTVSPSQLSP